MSIPMSNQVAKQFARFCLRRELRIHRTIKLGHKIGSLPTEMVEHSRKHVSELVQIFRQMKGE